MIYVDTMKIVDREICSHCKHYKNNTLRPNVWLCTANRTRWTMYPWSPPHNKCPYKDMTPEEAIGQLVYEALQNG